VEVDTDMNEEVVDGSSTTLAQKKGKDSISPEDKIEKIDFFSGNPSVEVTNGVIHLYRDNKIELHDYHSLPKKQSAMVCVLAVPATMTVYDFIKFTNPCQKSITNMRIIRDSSPNKYMVIIKFTDIPAATEFYKTFNGCQYNSLEPEACHILFVADVELHTKNAPLFPPSGQTEIPNCPVCLERLDSSVSGILTILCNHSFHCDCLSKWIAHSSCPVCRFVQLPVEMTSSCNTCATTESLWICLICGHVGCGRYVNFHAEQHYRETMHTYALELETQRVWDYAGDGYVHRIIQNKTDGKLVEFPGVHSHSDFRDSKDDIKLEAINMEYNFLLTSQLETQRAYFEKQIANIQKDKEGVEKAKQKAEQRVLKLQEKVEKLTKDFVFVEQVNSALCKNQEEWKAKIAQTEQQLKDDSKEKQIQDLQDQIRDLMFFIEAKKTVEQSGDLQGGSLVTETSPSASSSSIPRKSKHKTKKR